MMNELVLPFLSSFTWHEQQNNKTTDEQTLFIIRASYLMAGAQHAYADL
jgi:hypothetical protein